MLAAEHGAAYSGGPADGLAVMAMLRALYESARTKMFGSLESGQHMSASRFHGKKRREVRV